MRAKKHLKQNTGLLAMKLQLYTQYLILYQVEKYMNKKMKKITIKVEQNKNKSDLKFFHFIFYIFIMKTIKILLVILFTSILLT